MGTLKTLLASPAAAVIFAAAVTTLVNEFAGGPSGVTFGAAITVAAGAFWAALSAAGSERALREKGEEIVATVTGGDSFCYVNAVFPTGGGDGFLAIQVNGSFPMYDVSLRIVDGDKLKTILSGARLTLDAIAPAEKYVGVGNLSPGTAAFLRQVTVAQDKDIRWNIFISARNGLFIQTLRMLRLGEGQWTSAMKVVREGPPEDVLLKQEINADYPRDSAGNVVW